MTDIITALLDLLYPTLFTQGLVAKGGVLQSNDVTEPSQLRGLTYPCVTVHSLGEDGTPGPFAGTATRNFHVRCRMWDQWANPLTAVTPTNATSLFVLTDAIRELLNTDKALAVAAPDFLYYRRVPDRVVDLPRPIPTGAGQVIARDLMLDYWRLEDWSGPVNPQPGLISPSAA